MTPVEAACRRLYDENGNLLASGIIQTMELAISLIGRNDDLARDLLAALHHRMSIEQAVFEAENADLCGGFQWN